MKKKKIQRRSGVTLVEVMVASAILMLFVAGFIGAFTAAMRTVRSANNHYRAMSISRNRMQRARTADFNSLDLLQENNVRIDAFGNLDNTGRFRRTTQVNTNWPTPHTLWVHVSVRYPIGTSTNMSAPVEVESLIATRM